MNAIKINRSKLLNSFDHPYKLNPKDYIFLVHYQMAVPLSEHDVRGSVKKPQRKKSTC